MNLFLLATFVYRFANGLLFLAVAWNLVRSGNGGAMPLALSAIGGFLPAVVAAPFARQLLERVDPRKLTLWGIAGLCASAVAFIPLLHVLFGVLAINFLVLSIFFLLEGAWDALLAATANRLPSKQGDTLNSRQSAATQAGLMLGGLPVGLLIRHGGIDAPFLAAAVLYIVTLLLFTHPSLRSNSDETRRDLVKGASQPLTVLDEPPNAPAWTTVATLALVWPCLTLVNMAVPLTANTQGHGTVEHAALLDAFIGLGMACIGVLYERLMRLSARWQRYVIVTAAAFMPLPFLALLTISYTLPVLCAAFFLCGIGFGMLRVSLRKQLIATQPARRVGQIVASCNAYGFPILAMLALLYARSWNFGPWVPLAAFFAMAVVGVSALLGGATAERVRSRATPEVG
ncbi:MFS transporter [Caballeronia ptereochthonis]|uniref:Major Facilitator Superfamily protein n=1 Tax=Caballeronia ptereochthonis TaxID=1777144 RepID=A0A158DZB6_9BURK|nr:MFS transporter [Caballeronia ptereochthonis]SAK99985.1 Major Facilitator Superfamily protein [Caballeronia ptereochthonis]